MKSFLSSPLSILRRRPSESEGPVITSEIPALTGLRGFAAVWVLLYHAWAFAGPKLMTFEQFGIVFDFTPFFSTGWAGVQIFFVLSGFLLSLPFVRWQTGLRARPPIKIFLIRRIARVFPAYYLQLFLLLGMGWLAQRSLPINTGEIPQYLLMLFLPSPIGVGSAPLNGVWWTLPIELSFYFSLPILSIFLAWQRRWLLLGGALLVMIFWRWFVVDVLQVTLVTIWAYQLPGAIDSFALGMFGAMLHVKFYEQGSVDINKYKRALAWLLPIALIVYALMFKWMHLDYLSYWKSSPLFYMWTPICSLSVFVVILAGAARLAIIDVIFGNRAMQLIGVISYGIYLWHIPVLKWLLDESWIGAMEGYQFPWLFLISAVLSFILATLSWVLVEKKAIASCHSYFKNKQKSA